MNKTNKAHLFRKAVQLPPKPIDFFFSLFYLAHVSSSSSELHSIVLLSLFLTVRSGESPAEILREIQILKTLENKGFSSLNMNLIMQVNSKPSLIA